jgi:hypothetical protein
MAPTEFSYDKIATVRKGITDFYGMVTAFDVVFPILLIFGHDGCRVRRIGTVRHYSDKPGS